MPKGEPSKQTLRTERYQKKAGWTTKGIKMKKELADEFKEACEKAGVSQASVVTKAMRDFIDAQKD